MKCKIKGDFCPQTLFTPQSHYKAPFYTPSPNQIQKGEKDLTPPIIQEAFKFTDERFKVWCLAANALHVERKKPEGIGKGLRLADDAKALNLNTIIDPEETSSSLESRYNIYNNVDSIVLKISYGNSSAILTGDATGVVTNRILDNYSNDLDFLKSNILLASHHGSSSHLSNDKTWIKAVDPYYVLVSNGLKFMHPHEDAYKAFKASTFLTTVEPHFILVGGKNMHTGALKESYDIHNTYKGIFSTLSNGNIKAKFSLSSSNPTENIKIYLDDAEQPIKTYPKITKEEKQKIDDEVKKKAESEIAKIIKEERLEVIKGRIMEKEKELEEMKKELASLTKQEESK